MDKVIVDKSSSELFLHWIDCTIYQATPKYLPHFFHTFSIIFLCHLIKNRQTQTTIAVTFLTHNISGIGGVGTQNIS